MKSWSISRLEVFEKCGYRAKLQFDDRQPQPTNDPKREEARTRGDALHLAAQDYVAGKRDDLDPALGAFSSELGVLREAHPSGNVLIEDEWGFDQNFNQVGWYEAWARMKLDFLYRNNPTRALVIDLKSGKKDGNQLKHTDQGQFYAVGTMLKYPETEIVDVEFWYIDQDDSMNISYTAEQAAGFMKKFKERGDRATAGVYEPRANIFTCKYCPYRQETLGGTGACDFASGPAPKKRAKPTSGFFDFGR